MKPTTKKIISIILNFVMVIIFIAYTVLSALGQLKSESTNIFMQIGSYIFMSTPVLAMLAIAMSITLRNEGEYSKSIFVQLLPFLGLTLAQIFVFLSLI